jgi:diaminohydroxyphosphoribosylaminopyrimidine deaminase/5-amino-6-(5-phosphoribosylamino)uracil reductase
MRRALALAQLGLYATDPNPRVGCVIAREEEIVGEGWHRRAGEPHAEALALAAAGDRAQGAAVYVTLEPCSHHGRTPPCADALIKAGVQKVVCAHQDPNPRVNGAGNARLRAAGILIEVGLFAADARALNPGFVQRHERGWPWVRVKIATSLDGHTALADGTSRWITGAEARADVQHWRARSSVIVTGVGTVLADDPRLDVRMATNNEPPRQPLRVVLDSSHRTPAAARIVAPPGECWIFTARGKQNPAGAAQVTTHTLTSSPGGLDLNELVAKLVARDTNEVWVEAGPRLAGAFVASGLVDELLLYVAPKMLATGARPMLDQPANGRIEEGARFRFTDVRQLGDDLRIIAVPRQDS